MRTIALLLKRWLPRRTRQGHISPLSVLLILGGVPIAIAAGYIGWMETESLLFTLLSAGLPALLVLAGIFSLID